jgi:hypothetical protein
MAEDVPEVGRRLAGPVEVADAQPGLDLAGRAAGGRDEALAVALQQFAVGARVVVVALEAGQRPEPEQVVQALGVGREHRHVRVGPAAGDVVLAAVGPAHPRLVLPGRARGQVGLHADDRADARGGGLLVKVVGAVEVAVVGHGERRHAHPGRLREQILQPRGAVQHRILGVDVQVNEGIPGGHADTLVRPYDTARKP